MAEGYWGPDSGPPDPKDEDAVIIRGGYGDRPTAAEQKEKDWKAFLKDRKKYPNRFE